MTLFHPFVLDNAAGQETVVGIGSDSEKYGVGISSHVHITGIGTFSDLLHTTGVIHAAGGIKDTSGNIGSSGKVLSSTGSGLAWIDPSTGSTTNAVNVGINLNSTDADQFVAFVGSSSGNNPIRVDAGLKYNPNSNVLTTGGNIMPDADDSQDLGSSTKRWRNIFTGDLQLSNVTSPSNTDESVGIGNEVDGTQGTWTIQEGTNDLFLINRINGKKYKFNLIEIS